MLECVVNISEGTDRARIEALREVVAPVLLDAHSDPAHNRTVLTLAGDADALATPTQDLTRLAVATLDLHAHRGVHPRIGVVDVVPFVDLDEPTTPWTGRTLDARARYAAWAATELDLPSFFYGPERTLPDIRRTAWRPLAPDAGPDRAHPTAGAVCVGVRGVLVAYNLVLGPPDLALARRVAAAVRRAGLRTLALETGASVQISCNLTDPGRLGPGDAYDLVADALARDTPEAARIVGCELVGLLPEAALAAIPPRRWAALDLGPDRTIESRLGRLGGR